MKRQKYYGLCSRSNTILMVVVFPFIMFIVPLWLFLQMRKTHPFDFALGYNLFFEIMGIIILLCGKGNLINRFSALCKFSPEGITYMTLLWGKRLIRWEDIHAYAMTHSSYSNVSMDLLMLSTNREESDKSKEYCLIRKDRIVFEMRPDLMEPICEYMPPDMRKRLEESWRTSVPCYMRR